MKNKFNLKALLLLTLALSGCSQFNYRDPANSQNCQQAISAFVNNDHVSIASAHHVDSAFEIAAKKSIRYPKEFEGQAGKNIQYGFESEYLHEETDAFFINYMPAPELYKGTKETWLALTPKQRLDWIDKNIKTLFGYRSKGKLIKISDDPELNAALPDSFVYDVGHFELVLDPMESAEELVKKIKVINKHFGVGSMQMTISNPINKDMLENFSYKNKVKKELVGYYNFMNDYDTITKLSAGYERYLINPDIQTAKSFNHPWLGPMTKLKHDRLTYFVTEILNLKDFSDEELKNVSDRVVSHKFIGGLSFRPDVAYKKGRIASEVRDCHQNIKCIEDRIMRETYFLMKGREAFAAYNELMPFDSVKSFSSLSREIQGVLRTVFPAHNNSQAAELEMFRNFSFPLRDWTKHIELLGTPELKSQIESAQKDYIESLSLVAKDFNNNTLNKKEAQIKIMGLLGEFIKKSGIDKMMKNQYEHLIDSNEMRSFDHLKLSRLIRKLLMSTMLA